MYLFYLVIIEKFLLFKGKILEEIFKYLKFLVYVMFVMYVLVLYIDNLYDIDFLVEFVKKIVVSYIGCVVGLEYFKVVLCNFCINCYLVNLILLGIFYFINLNV